MSVKAEEKSTGSGGCCGCSVPTPAWAGSIDRNLLKMVIEEEARWHGEDPAEATSDGWKDLPSKRHCRKAFSFLKIPLSISIG